jgi:hypothetical protein
LFLCRFLAIEASAHHYDPSLQRSEENSFFAQQLFDREAGYEYLPFIGNKQQ